jgi:hypothetical protein
MRLKRLVDGILWVERFHLYIPTGGGTKTGGN